MKFSYNWLQSHFNKKLPKPEKLAEILTMRSFEVSVVEQINNSKDWLLECEILPNRRADCLSHLGIARECAALLNYELRITNYELRKNLKLQTKDYLKLTVKEPSLCPKYAGLLMRNVKVGPSPKWLQERLASVGQKPINNIVDATNYMMLETGQPLHAFDLEKLEGRQIIVRKARGGEKITTLDNKVFSLTPDMLVIADKNDPLAIAGIKGGKNAEIANSTKDIVIEAAVFNPANIRNTSKSLGLKTDASLRFESGISIFLPEEAINGATGLIREIAGGEIAGGRVDFCAVKPMVPEIFLKTIDFLKLTGCSVSDADAVRILKSLNFDVLKRGKFLRVRPPKERTDIKIKEDVIEELVRICGYDEIKGSIPEEILIPPAKNDIYIYTKIIRDILTGLGFSEVYNYSFVSSGEENLRLKNPVSSDKAYLRQNLTDGLSRNISDNLKYFSAVKIFEIGKVFYPLSSSAGEESMLAGALGYQKKKEHEIFYELKGAVETVLNKLGIADLWFKEKEQGFSAEIIVGNEIIGRIGTGGFELKLQKIIELSEEDQAYEPISRYPAITRDLAVFVPQNTKVAELLDVIENTAGELLIDTDLFDMFEPEEEDCKSLAFHLVFQSSEKTLTDDEVNKIVDKIIKALEENLEWEVRKQELRIVN